MSLITRLPIAPNFNFLGKRKFTLAFSAGLMILSVALFLISGLNFGVDFRGGILLEVEITEQADISQLRDRVSGLGLGDVTMQTFGDEKVILINVERQDGAEGAQSGAISSLRQALGELVVEYRRQEFVGPKVGDELKRAGILATVLALLGIGFYIWFRFEWHFSIAAMAALAHDVIATIGFFSLTQIEFNLATLAAVLTIAGYSINDTVVIFDRVREELRRYKKLPLVEVLNRAVNRTLTRTALTSVTTLLALFALFIFGGEVIRGFSMGLIWGVVIGTYSSIALAVPLLTFMNMRRSAEAAGPPEVASPEAS